MLPPVFSLLKQSAAVKAIVGTNPPRVYRHGWAPEKADSSVSTDPYVTWQLVSGVPENSLSEVPSIDRQTVQVDCWHESDKGVELLAEAVRDAIEPSAHMTSTPIDLREPETKLFRISLQFDFFLPR